MKITMVFGFNGGQLHAECETFEQSDEILNYALKRGIITFGSAMDGEAQAPVPEVQQPEEKPAKPVKIVAGHSKAEIMEGIPAVKAPTVAEAQQAVKDYAAKHGVEAGRALLAKFNLKRTMEITDTNAADVYAAAKE